jgi:hypothetical protein
MEMFDYNGDNVKQACQTIKNSLSSDLLPKIWKCLIITVIM